MKITTRCLSELLSGVLELIEAQELTLVRNDSPMRFKNINTGKGVELDIDNNRMLTVVYFQCKGDEVSSFAEHYHLTIAQWRLYNSRIEGVLYD